MKGVRLTGLLLLPPLAVYGLAWIACEVLAGMTRADSLGVSAIPTGVVAAAVPVLLATRRDQRPDPTKVLCGLIPTRPVGYQRRGDIQRRLTASRGVTVVHALTGTRGVGKSVEAAEYARARLAKGIRVAWINAENGDQILAGYAAIADHLGLREPEEPASESAARALRALADPDWKLLIVFDNVLDPEPVRAWMPTGPRVQVVITTTEQAATALGAALDVGRFSRTEARDFLAERTGTADGADELIAELDNLPLALSHAAARIVDTGQSFDEYVRDLRAFPVERALPRATWDQYPRSVAAAVLLSVEQVTRGEDADEVWRVLRQLAVMSPGGVPIELLHKDSADDRFAVSDACARLRAASLVVYAGTDVVMHRLTQRVIREQSDTPTLIAVISDVTNRVSDRLLRAIDHELGQETRDLVTQVGALITVSPRETPDGVRRLLHKMREYGLGAIKLDQAREESIEARERWRRSLDEFGKGIGERERAVGRDDPAVVEARVEYESGRERFRQRYPDDPGPPDA